jgi:predicted signal transduction protein with EAL and GGDEF domain
MARTVRDGENAAVARLGGDEFIVLLSDLAAPGDAGRVADRILDALKRPVVIDGQECWVGASIGIASFPDDGDSAEILLVRADAAMYEAKTAGRGVWRAYQPSLANPSMETLRLEGDLRKAVQRGELRLYWQPIVDISTGKIAGCEALMRWQRGDKLVSPAEFIPLAEETGLIIPMGEWALETACTQMAEWNKAGLDGIYVGVNITSKHVQQRDLLKVIKQVLAASHLPADRLVVEITETGLMDFIDSTLRTLTALRELGVRIAIDDFGTGYSSLSYLKRLPISTLKIDRAFVKEVDHDVDDAAIVSAVSGIARSLSLSVVAEGVETVEQSAVLFEHGVKLMQGYYYSRPVPAADFEKLLRATSGAACRADWIASGRGLQSGIA